MSGKTNPKSMQTMGGPVLDVCWHDVSIFQMNRAGYRINCAVDDN